MPMTRSKGSRRARPGSKGVSFARAFVTLSLLCVLLALTHVYTYKHAALHAFQVEIRTLDTPAPTGSANTEIEGPSQDQADGAVVTATTEVAEPANEGGEQASVEEEKERVVESPTEVVAYAKGLETRLKGKSPAQRFREFQRHSSRPVREDRVRQKQRQHHKKIATLWAKLLVKTSFSVDLEEVCSSRHIQAEVDLQKDNADISTGMLSQVRSCLRAVIAHSEPWNR